jgi:O-methyltransferase
MLRKSIKTLVRKLGFDVVRVKNEADTSLPIDFGTQDAEIIARVKPYTYTTNERIVALTNAIRYLIQAKIPGDIVECGVWRGGSMMAAALALKETGHLDRNLYLFDTYEGMSKPTESDVNIAGESAAAKFETMAHSTNGSQWCLAALDEVKKNMALTGYPNEHLRFVKGRVEDTIPELAPPAIALLRLDTDWYESTRHELVHLFPRLCVGGVLILDDYGHWQGARKAVDEYLAENDISLLLNRIDYTGRIAVKTAAL